MKTIIALLLSASLVGCAGSASPGSLQTLADATARCNAGDARGCAVIPMAQLAVNEEKAASAQANTAVAAGLLGALLGAAIDASTGPSYVVVRRCRFC